MITKYKYTLNQRYLHQLAPLTEMLPVHLVSLTETPLVRVASLTEQLPLRLVAGVTTAAPTSSAACSRGRRRRARRLGVPARRG